MGSDPGFSIRSALLLCLLIVAGYAHAATLTVCPSGCDHTSIQAAVTAAIPGDTIQISSVQAQTEADILIAKNLTIDGFGTSATVVQANAAQGVATLPVFIVAGGASVTMRSLTIRHGGGTDGGGVSLLDGSLLLDDVHVVNNDAGDRGGGVWVAADGVLRARDSKINSNSASEGGGVAVLGWAEFVNSEVSHNSCTSGGGIYSTGSVTVRSSSVSNNTVLGSYGGIYHDGASLLVDGAVIDHNTSGFDGGGVDLGTTGRVAIRRSSISWNQGDEAVNSISADLLIEDCSISYNQGLGMRITVPDPGTVRVANTTLRGNQALEGAGLRFFSVGGTAVLANSTITQNTSTRSGAGLYAASNGLEIVNSTITNNTADFDADGSGDGGGIYVESSRSVVMRNTLVADNNDNSPLPGPLAGDCAGTIDSEGYNLIDFLGFPSTLCIIQGDTTGNQHGVDPLLSPIADNGGPTLTHAIASGSPAEDAGNPAGCVGPDDSPLDMDQRHGIREDRCDIGSFELSAVNFEIFSDGFESSDCWLWSGGFSDCSR